VDFRSILSLAVLAALLLFLKFVKDKSASGEDVSRHLAFLNRLRSWGKKVILSVLLALIVLVGALDGIYIVPSGSEGVLFRLGEVKFVAEQGPHVKIPFVDVVEVVNTENIRRFEYGYRTVSVGPPARYRDVPDESKMLTRDNKIIEIDWVLQYQISDPVDYVTHIPENQGMRERMIRDIAESFMREVIGARILDDVLTKEKQAIQTEVRKGLQDKMNALSTGIFVSSISLQDVIPPQAVQKAFNAVNSARAEKERMILEAERYAKEIASEMAGDVERILNEANAYAFRRVALAEGDVARLSALNEAYRVDPDLVKLNLWMETMTDVWKEINPLFLRSSESLKFLPLDRFIEPSEKDAKGD